MPDNSRYVMRLSLNVLNHVGLYLYSNTPAVLAEAIANAWDADATEVHVDLDAGAKTISVKDDGVGMDLNDINDKFLYVGYRKRPGPGDVRTARGRKPMGRKGIGKLSLFSIADTIRVYTRKRDGEPESFLMDGDVIRRTIKAENPSTAKEYAPARIEFDQRIPDQGTTLKISDLKKVRLTSSSSASLKKRIARRFTVLGDGFRIYVNGEQVTFQDRDYFHKARFIFQYGRDYSGHCRNLDTETATGHRMKYDRRSRFDDEGVAKDDGKYDVQGWVAIARRSNDLDGETSQDNLNKGLPQNLWAG